MHRPTTILALSFLGAAACASTPKEADPGIDLSNDQVVLPGETPGGGDEELDGGDFLVQVEKDYKVGKFQGGGDPVGKTGFDLTDGSAVTSATYYKTRKAGMADLVAGKIGCYFADNEQNDVYAKAPSKEAARAGRWRCRAVRDLSGKDSVNIGDAQVARDNIRVQVPLGSSGL